MKQSLCTWALAALFVITCSNAIAQSFEIEPLHSGQDQVSTSVAFYNAGRSTPYVGLNVDAGRSFSSHFTAVGGFDVTSLDGIWLTGYQAGGRLNLLKRGRFIPFVVATGGLLHASADGPFGRGANGFGFGVGGGVIVRVNNRVETKFEVKQNQITTLGGFTLNQWYTTAMVGVGYRFDSPNW